MYVWIVSNMYLAKILVMYKMLIIVWMVANFLSNQCPFAYSSVGATRLASIKEAALWSLSSQDKDLLDACLH
jgi:hypothetical protein